MNTVFLKDQLAKLQTATSTQIFQVYLLFVLFSLFFSQIKLSAGSEERCSTYRSCAALSPVLGRGMDETEDICSILQETMLKQPPGCSTNPRTMQIQGFDAGTRFWALTFHKCSKSIIQGCTRWASFPLWVRLFHDPLSTLSPKMYPAFRPVSIDIKNGFLSWWNTSASSLLLGKTSSCWASLQQKPSGAIVT